MVSAYLFINSVISNLTVPITLTKFDVLHRVTSRKEMLVTGLTLKLVMSWTGKSIKGKHHQMELDHHSIIQREPKTVRTNYYIFLKG